MNFFQHVWHALRYGEWDFWNEQWPGKRQFGFAYAYYDGHWFAFHIGRFAITCCY